MSDTLNEQNWGIDLSPPEGPVAQKWSMFLMLGEPGYPQRHAEALFGGAVGGGKSRALVTWLLLRAANYPGIRLALARDTLTNLKRSTLKSLFEAADGRIAEDSKSYDKSYHAAHYSKRDDVIYFGNGSEIHLFGLKDAQALDRLVGPEWGGIAIDQLERVPFKSYVEIVPRARQFVRHRETGEVVWPMVKSTANLTTKRTSWVARHFLYGAPTTPLAKGKLGNDIREMRIERVIEGERIVTWRAFFKVALGENKSVNPHYMKLLASVADHIGGFLVDEWEEDLEQIFAFEWSGDLITEEYPLATDLSKYDLYVGLDWGWGASPTTALYGLWDRYEKKMYMVGEYVEYGRDIDDYARDIAADMLTYVGQGVRTVRVFADPSLWNKSGFGSTAAAHFNKAFRNTLPASARIIMAPAFKKGTVPVRSKQRVDTAKRLMRQRSVTFYRHGVPQLIDVLSVATWGEVTKDRHPTTDIFDAFAYMTMNVPLKEALDAQDDPDALPAGISPEKSLINVWGY